MLLRLTRLAVGCVGLRELTGDSDLDGRPGERYTPWFVIQSSRGRGIVREELPAMCPALVSS